MSTDKNSPDNEVRKHIEASGFEFPEHLIMDIIGITNGKLKTLATMDKDDLIADIPELRRSQAGSLITQAKEALAQSGQTPVHVNVPDLTGQIAAGTYAGQQRVIHDNTPIERWDDESLLNDDSKPLESRIAELGRRYGLDVQFLAIPGDEFEETTFYPFDRVNGPQTVVTLENMRLLNGRLPGDMDDNFIYVDLHHINEGAYKIYLAPNGEPISQTTESKWLQVINNPNQTLEQNENDLLMGHWLQQQRIPEILLVRTVQGLTADATGLRSDFNRAMRNKSVKQALLRGMVTFRGAGKTLGGSNLQTPASSGNYRNNNLSIDAFNQLVDLLLPHIANSRESAVLGAWYGSPILNKVSYSGSGNDFTVSLIRTAISHGEIKPGIPAIVALIQTVIQTVGSDRQRRLSGFMDTYLK